MAAWVARLARRAGDVSGVPWADIIAKEEAAMLSALFEIPAPDFRVESMHPETWESPDNTSKTTDVAAFRHPNSGPIQRIGARKPRSCQCRRHAARRFRGRPLGRLALVSST